MLKKKAAFKVFEIMNGLSQIYNQNENRVIHSTVFPGLRLDINALLKGDLAGVAAELQKGLQSQGHAEFVRRLKS